MQWAAFLRRELSDRNQQEALLKILPHELTGGETRRMTARQTTPTASTVVMAMVARACNRPRKGIES
jgi:hypothetical protein